MKINKKLIALSLCVCCLLCGCGDGKINRNSNDNPDEFRVIMNTAWSGFSPLKTNDQSSNDIQAQIYETLYRRTIDGKSFEPLLAKELPICDAAGTTCTIPLKEGIKFQDGTDFDAYSVKYVLEKIKDPNSGSARASIAGSIETIDCPDKYTVVIKTSYPDGVLTAKLAHYNSSIFSPTADQKQDLMIDPVGTGPYKYVSSVSGSEVLLTRNEEYWGDKPAIKDVRFTVVAEPSTAASRLETEEADLIRDLNVTQIGRVEAMRNVTLKSEESARINYVFMRTDEAKHPQTMMDLNARRAIAYAIDSEGFLNILNGHATHSNSLISPLVFGYTEKAETFGYHYNPEKAKQLVKEHGLDKKDITILTSNVALTQTLAEYIQANLIEAGFRKVDVIPMDYTSYLNETKVPGAFDISILGWSNVTGDGTELLEPNFSDIYGQKRVLYYNEELEKLIKEGKETTDREKRIEKLEAANKLLLDQAIAVPIYNQNKVYAYSNKYKNVELDAGGMFYVKDIKLAK